MKDLIIIGAGPAGITAAIYAARKKLDFFVITQNIGGQAAWAGEVGNYSGFHLVTGAELSEKFQEHMSKYSISIQEKESVQSVEKIEGGFSVTSDKGAYQTKTVIVATGKKSRLLNVPGEFKYSRKGVHYCATCDGPVFSGKEVAIVGAGNSALDAALQMIKIAKKVYVIVKGQSFSGDAVMIEKVKTAPNLSILFNAAIKEIRGDKFVNGIIVEQEGKINEIPLQGIFIEIGLVPNSSFISIVDKNEKSEILIDCAACSSIPGIFAAGDVTMIPGKQIIIAAGDGAKAVLSAFDYLSRL